MASDQTLCRGPETQIRPQASAAETGSPASAQGRAAIASLALPKTRRARPPCGWRKPARARRGMRPGTPAPPAIPVSHLRSIGARRRSPHRNPARCDRAHSYAGSVSRARRAVGGNPPAPGAACALERLRHPPSRFRICDRLEHGGAPPIATRRAAIAPIATPEACHAPAVRLAETRPHPARHAPWNACATPRHPGFASAVD